MELKSTLIDLTNGAYTPCEVVWTDSSMTIKNISTGKAEIIPRANITGVYKRSETELTEKNRSVLGRALVGGALFGGIGAIVGGMSGLKGKTKKTVHWYFIVSYNSNGAIVERIFEDTSFPTKTSQIVMDFNK